MNKQFHSCSPEPDDGEKLDIDYLSEEVHSTLIFEPSELIDFRVAWDWQKQRQKMLFEKPFSSQAVWLLEHSECYTLGRGATEDNLLFNVQNSPWDVYRVDRGGEVTHHLPGQIVVYLVLDLRRYKTDLNWYLRQLELVLLDTLQDLDIVGKRIDGITGVWIDDFKVASIGIGCRRWITQHGLSINVDCDLNGFDRIIPCGLVGSKVGKLTSFIPGLKTVDVKPLIRKSLTERFGL